MPAYLCVHVAGLHSISAVAPRTCAELIKKSFIIGCPVAPRGRRIIIKLALAATFLMCVTETLWPTVEADEGG